MIAKVFQNKSRCWQKRNAGFRCALWFDGMFSTLSFSSCSESCLLARDQCKTKAYCNQLCCWLGLKVRFLVVCDAIARYGLSLIDALCISSCAHRCERRCSVAAGLPRRFSYAGGSWRQAISSACNERIAAFQRPLAGATVPQHHQNQGTSRRQ